MGPLLIAAAADAGLARTLAVATGGDVAEVLVRAFPDGELYVRVETPVEGRDVWVICTMLPAGEKLLNAFMLASTARDLGAKTVGLVAPYLAYLRQDRRFQKGEGVSSKYVGKWLSGVFDRILTLDPHLHRYDALSEVYKIPATALKAAPSIAEWIGREVENPVIVGPDVESAQWVDAVAKHVGCKAVIFEKVRFGDADVKVSAPATSDISVIDGKTPILVDDIISTGATMVEALRVLKESNAQSPICVGIHGVFSGGFDAVAKSLQDAGASRIVTCNTIPHSSNAIDISTTIAAAMKTSI